jgi:hypothetical protein
MHKEHKDLYNFPETTIIRSLSISLQENCDAFSSTKIAPLRGFENSRVILPGTSENRLWTLL